MAFQEVAEESSLSEGQLLSVSLEDGEQICLARVEGRVFALQDRCPHADFPLSDGSLEGGFQLECALHGAVFDLRDGSVQAPPAEQPAKTYGVKIEHGAIWVEVPDGG